MVMMSDPFVGNVPKKLSREELIQALRVDVAGELEAIMGYDAHATATDDQRVKTILYSIRDEERRHVGELLRLMEILDPQEAQFLAKGRQEVEQLLNQKGQSGQPNQMQQGQQAKQPAQSQQYQYSPAVYTQPGMQPGHTFQQPAQGQQTSQWSQGQHQNFNQYHGGTEH